MPKSEISSLRNLAKKTDLVIIKPDKGNGVVILDKNDYNTKSFDILSDYTKFRILNNDTLDTNENKLNRILRKLLKQGHITNDLYNELFISGSRPGFYYGLPKIHKPNAPLRPIISGVGTFCHPTAKFLAKLLLPLTKNDNILKDTFDFVNRLKSITLQSAFTVSFDVSSLFTNVPLQETIDIIVQRIYDKNEITTTIPRDDMKSLLSLCTSKSCFLFNDTLYEQIDGISMGSPLGPVMANIFMIYFETLLQERSNIIGMKYWYRYVDDVFAIFNVKPDLTAILQELNSVHRNIKFSYEPETDGKLHFLDVNVHYNTGKFLTNTYSKPTNTGLYTLWSSFTPKLYKSNLFICLLQRSYRICTNWASFISEIESLQTTFVKIGYPRNFVLNIQKTLSIKFFQIN